MRYNLFENQKNEIILLARILLMILFVVSGWGKLTGFNGTVAYFNYLGAPFPLLAAGVAIVVELVVGIAIAVGFYTRPLSLVFILFVFGTIMLGHNFWAVADAERANNITQALKNISIVGGLLLLIVTGPGKYSIDGK